ncbi:taste receptor type 2 member 125-like [Nannospalax galili]|uniref:taste receptor type 2 member 125-like n=1 Tax=Nannospalax galili TaxID=1026970 RepID=UPI00111C5846|nr:taste receptor type 2 member 125-like [Nannospalax galili]
MVLSVEFIIGTIGNGFIALVNIMDWVKRRKISSVSQILTPLAISRITVLVSVFITMLASIVHPSLLMAVNVIRVIKITFTVTNHFDTWLTTCLSIFYFLKIANFSNSIFLYLKWRVKKVVSVIMLVSLVLLLLYMVLTNVYIDDWDGELQRNMCHSSSWNISSRIVNNIIFTNYMVICVPLALSLSAFLLLLFSLWKHLKKMKHNTRDASTRAHIQALKTVFACLLLGILFFISFFEYVAFIRYLNTQLIISYGLGLLMTFSSSHSWVIIFGDSRLRQASISLLSWLRCRFKVVVSMGP